MIIGLACVWKFTRRGHDGTPAGSARYYTDKADPGTTNFVPRPDWYFYFLFYLLRIFKWPDTVILGTVGVPTILLMLLLALPFIDLRRERRLLAAPGGGRRGDPRRHRDGHADLQGRDREGGARLARRSRPCPSGRRSRASPDNEQAVAGREALRPVAGCLQLPHLPRRRRRRTSARPTSPTIGATGQGVAVLPALRREPGAVREHVDAAVRERSATSNLQQIARLPRRLQGPEVR